MLNKADALQKTKMLLGIEGDSRDNLLSFLIDDCERLALDYCRIDELPEGLYDVIPQMAARKYRDNGYGTEAAPQTVKSLSQGARSVGYSDTNSGTDSFLNSFKSRLNPFRNRKGRVPSDLDKQSV